MPLISNKLRSQEVLNSSWGEKFSLEKQSTLCIHVLGQGDIKQVCCFHHLISKEVGPLTYFILPWYNLFCCNYSRNNGTSHTTHSTQNSKKCKQNSIMNKSTCEKKNYNHIKIIDFENILFFRPEQQSKQSKTDTKSK